MMRRLSPREARLVAILLLVAAFALAYLAVISPVLAGFAERSERRAELQARFAANERIIGAIPRLRRTAEAQQRAIRAFLVTARDESSAAEILRDRVQNAISAVEGDFRGSEDLPAADGRIAARASAALTAAQLERFLAKVQNDPPFLVIDALAINADEAAIVGRAVPMEIQIDVSIPFRPAR